MQKVDLNFINIIKRFLNYYFSETICFEIKQTIILLAFFLWFFLPMPAFSQDKKDSIPITTTTRPYILKFDTLLSISYNVNSEFDFFEVLGDDFDYDIRPNISFSNKLSFSYRFVILKLGFKPKFFPGNNDNDLQGKTKAYSVNFNYFSRHWLQELKYGYVKGFYLHNTGDFEQEWIKGTDPYIQFPDLKVNLFSGSTGYKLNPNFSMNAISSQTQKQLRSCGSLIPFLSYDYYIVDNKSDDPNQSSSQKTNNFNLTASAGYIYTFVIGSDFHLSMGVFPGLGLQHTKLLTRMPEGDYINTYSDPIFRIGEKAGIGYSTNKFFAGAEVSLAQATHNENNNSVKINITRAFFQVYVGYRFKAPGFLKREADWAKSKAPGVLNEDKPSKVKIRLSQ